MTFGWAVGLHPRWSTHEMIRSALVGPRIRTALKLLSPCWTNGFQACAASYPPPGIGLCDFVRSVLRVWWPTRVHQLSAKHRTSSSARSAWAADFDDHCFGGVHSGLVGQHRDSGRALRHPHYPVPAVREAQVWGEDGHQEVSGHFLADVFGSNEGRCALEPTSRHARAKRLCLIGLLVSLGKSDV